MNLVLLKETDICRPGYAVIDGRRFQHLMTINKVALQDELRCGLLNGGVGNGIVTRISATCLEMKICLENDPPEPLPLILVLALPRPKMLRRIIQQVTTLGVKTIYLINAWRVEKSFWNSPVLSEPSLREQMILGLEQGADTILPRIYQRRFFTEFVKEELPDLCQDAVCMTAHPKTDRVCPYGLAQKSVLVVGPEGGFIDREIKTLESAGCAPCHIGPRILKVETAVTALISRLYLSA